MVDLEHIFKAAHVGKYLYYLLCCLDQIPDDEWNLLYVAVTRARNSLIITKNIRHIITAAGVRHDVQC